MSGDTTEAPEMLIVNAHPPPTPKSVSKKLTTSDL